MKMRACFKYLEIKKHLSCFSERNTVYRHCKGNHNLLVCYHWKINEKSKEKTEMPNIVIFLTKVYREPFIYKFCMCIRNNDFEYKVSAILNSASS